MGSDRVPQRPVVKVKVLAAACAALGFAACVPGSASTKGVVVITIEHSAFDPALLEVERGSTVRFVIHNEDPIAHEFIIGDEAVQLVHEEGTEAHHGSRPGEVSIPAGETRETTYTFDGTEDLIIGCHLPGHYDYGMRGAVKVM